MYENLILLVFHVTSRLLPALNIHDNVSLGIINYTNSCKETFENVNNNQRYFVLTIDKELCEVDGKTYKHLNFFPKCCPINSTYDINTKRCLKTRDENGNLELLQNNLLFRIDLRNCYTVIIDHVIENSSKITIDADRTMCFEGNCYPNTEYCFDFNVEHNLVLRTCEGDLTQCNFEADVSKNELQCVKKCCSDGKVFHPDNDTTVCNTKSFGKQCTIGYEYGVPTGNLSHNTNLQGKTFQC